MRENIGLFRGRTVKSDEWEQQWYYGYLYVDSWNGIPLYEIYMPRTDERHIQPKWYCVDPETVGECTGLRDKNGKLIFEGDILSINGASDDELVYVKYLISSFECVSPIWKYYRHRLEDNPEKYEIIGNIHDNPELLGGAVE